MIRYTPLKVADKMAVIAAGLMYRFLKKGRRQVFENLTHIFAREKLPPDAYNRYARKTFQNFARCLTDFLRLGFMTSKELLESVEPVGMDNCLKALQHKRGCVLITFHIGNWDYAGSYLAALGVPMSALVEELEPAMYELYTRHRERTGMETFPIAKSAYAFLDVIKNNRVLAILADRDIAKNGITVNIFGGKRSIPGNLGHIIVKKKIPVVFGYMVLNHPHRKHRYFGLVEPPLFFSDVDDFNRLLVTKMEETVRKNPDQWFVFQPEWIE